MPALTSYLRARWGKSEQEADDLLQSFLLEKVLNRDLFGQADRDKGRVRSLLMTTLDRFVIAAHRQRAGPGAGGRGVRSLDGDLPEPAGKPAADVFDLAWARHTLYRALELTRVECERSGRDHIWNLFAARLVAPALEGVERTRYGALQEQLGFASPEQGSNLLITAKRMFLRNLRSMVGEYVDDDSVEIEDELRRLRHILAQGRG